MSASGLVSTLRSSGLWLVVALLSLTLVLSGLLQARIASHPADLDFAKLPYQLGLWQGHETAKLGVTELDVLRLDRFTRRIYTKDDLSVFIYIGYWRKQSGEYQAAKHSPQVCLRAGGWNLFDVEERPVKLADGSVQPARSLSATLNQDAMLVYYWFFNGERVYTEDVQALMNSSFEALISGRTDGGIVEISAQLKDAGGKLHDKAEISAALEDFIRTLAPELRELVRHASESQ